MRVEQHPHLPILSYKAPPCCMCEVFRRSEIAHVPYGRLLRSVQHALSCATDRRKNTVLPRLRGACFTVNTDLEPRVYAT